MIGGGLTIAVGLTMKASCFGPRPKDGGLSMLTGRHGHGVRPMVNVSGVQS